jgi:uncharacterized membrane protein YbhN (UPF0104 family)
MRNVTTMPGAALRKPTTDYAARNRDAAPPLSRLRIARSDRDVFVSFSVAYLLGIAALVGLVIAGGFWRVIADSRALAALISAGVIPLSEDDPGLGGGVPSVQLWIASQEPVTWGLVTLAAALFIVVAVLKGVQFHAIARFQGVEGATGQHLRAYLYGNGIGRILPFRAGEAAWAAALEAQSGADLSRAARVIAIFKGFLIFELVVFSIIGLLLSDILAWATSLVPPLLMLGAAWLLMRAFSPDPRGLAAKTRDMAAFVGELWHEPHTMVRLVLLSLSAFFLVEFASYIVPQAFATPVVQIIQDELRLVVVTPSVVIMAVVGGYVARLVPVTPGGVGQFEWGVTLVLLVNGLPLTSAVIVALLISAVRYAAGLVLFMGMMLSYGIETSLRRVIAIMRREEPVVVQEAA